VEDRRSAGLYLEMTDLEPAAYAAARVDAVLAIPGALRATWWANQRPGRDEYPRRVPEFATLGVYEVGDAFAPPGTPDGVRGHHFRRTPRPGQGTLSGRPTVGLELVLVSPRSPDGAQALRDWADFVHIRHIAAASVPGFTMITPYENATGGEPRFLHFYEMDTPDAEAAFQAMTPATLARIGGPGTRGFEEWAGHAQLVIDYVNTFARIGERLRSRSG
jgi:hypothetical protein